MRGIRFVVDEKGRRVAVQIDLKIHGKIVGRHSGCAYLTVATARKTNTVGGCAKGPRRPENPTSKRIGYPLIAILFVVSASAAPPTLCSPSEVNVFSCGAGKKVISVCASKDAAADRGYLQYRFGAPAKVELAVPAAKPAPPAKSALAGNLVFSGGGGAYLRFQTGDYQYIVYTAIGKGWGTKDGVAVEQNGKRRGHVSCTDEPDSMMGPDYFTKIGLSDDKSDFDLP